MTKLIVTPTSASMLKDFINSLRVGQSGTIPVPNSKTVAQWASAIHSVARSMRPSVKISTCQHTHVGKGYVTVTRYRRNKA